MIRISGILCGSALAIAVLIVAFGVPEFSRSDAPEVIESPPIQQAAEPQVDAETNRPTSVAAVPPVETPTPVQAPPETEETVAQAVDAIVGGDPSGATPSVLAAANQENWYAFWSPFRSETAANGFIEQLQRTTGLDYRVVKQQPGVYEVAFAYVDDEDIQSKLDTISSATGLEMPDG